MKITYFQNIHGQWYWHLVARNGRTIADGAEGYTSKRNVLRAISRFKSLTRCLELLVEPEETT